MGSSGLDLDCIFKDSARTVYARKAKLRVDKVQWMLQKHLQKEVHEGGRPTTSISSPNHILLIFSSENDVQKVEGSTYQILNVNDSDICVLQPGICLFALF